ncbi:hypothetical protein [Tritonibacter mobilis]|uniref:Uncharacterized protein n=1 Tax=Tritonibacter mobilis F1926 TaxID=1265309 RepID=A0A1B1A0V6_9RHOB|nr:hypothetical protein [Tritonibacter mobilis]ANP40215.1 hypothetical protein K529_005490 [Tritonibacter mobilis F1926]KJZ25413.1 hypothetical protein TW79_07115 [Tritonibacter mobilis]
MGIFDDDDLFGNKDKPYSAFDKLGSSSDSMSAINTYRSGGMGHGLSTAQQIMSDNAEDDVDALFVGKPSSKKSFW